MAETVVGIVPRNNKEILHPEEAAASKADIAERHLTLEEIKAQMAFQAQQARQQQQDMRAHRDWRGVF